MLKPMHLGFAVGLVSTTTLIKPCTERHCSKNPLAEREFNAIKREGCLNRRFCRIAHGSLLCLFQPGFVAQLGNLHGTR
jgi:hypothetical protein